MKDRRQYKRFLFPPPVRIETMIAENKKVLDFVTRDISTSGTYIATLTSFPKGTQFNLDFTLPTDELKGFKNMESLKTCTGKMVRSTHYGFAIQFDKECPIENLKAL
jgi:hypothetical protein